MIVGYLLAGLAHKKLVVCIKAAPGNQEGTLQLFGLAAGWNGPPGEMSHGWPLCHCTDPRVWSSVQLKGWAAEKNAPSWKGHLKVILSKPTCSVQGHLQLDLRLHQVGRNTLESWWTKLTTSQQCDLVASRIKFSLPIFFYSWWRITTPSVGTKKGGLTLCWGWSLHQEVRDYFS